MNAKILLATQFVSLVIMLGTAESLFVNKVSTIMFAISFLLFLRCSIYISKHEKWLIKRRKE